MSNCGIVYVAVSDMQYLRYAIASALLIELNTRTTDIIIYSDLISQDVEVSDSIRLIKINIPCEVQQFKSRWLKTKIYSYSPFTRTLFIDADIIPRLSIDRVWNLQSSISMAVAFANTIGECNHISTKEKNYTLLQLTPDTIQFNSGVILFDKCTSVEQLFSEWHREWQIFGKHDQLALARAIAKTSCAVNLLDINFNCPSVLQDAKSVLIHYSGILNKQFFWSDVHPKIVTDVYNIFQKNNWHCD